MTFDLNNLLTGPKDFQIQDAYAINDTGEIVGQGEIDGRTRGFLLIPIPEPSAIALSFIAEKHGFRSVTPAEGERMCGVYCAC